MTSAPASPRGSDYAALSRQVRQAGLLDRRLRYYAWKITLTAAALALGWAAFAVIGNSWWQLGDAVFLAVVFAQFGFLGHDAGHGQVFRTRRANAVLGVACGNLGAGFSYDWWTGKHNRHHAHPNTEGADPDITIGVLAFSAARARAGAGRPATDLPLSGLPARPDAVPRGVQPARVKHPADDRARLPAPGVGGDAARRALRRLSRRGVLRAAAGQGGGVHRRAAGPARLLPGLLLRAQPQGHADPRSVRQDRLPATAGPDLAQRPRRLAHRLRTRRPELPDRAPSLPVHAPAEPAPGPGHWWPRSAPTGAWRTWRPACSPLMPRCSGTSPPSAATWPARSRPGGPPRCPLGADRAPGTACGFSRIPARCPASPASPLPVSPASSPPRRASRSPMARLPVGRLRHRKIGLHPVAVPAAALLLDDVPGLGEVTDDPERAALGDPDGRGDITQPHPRVAGDAQQHQSVVGQEAPGPHARKLPHRISGIPLPVSRQR